MVRLLLILMLWSCAANAQLMGLLGKHVVSGGGGCTTVVTEASQLNPVSGTYVQYLSTSNFTGNPTTFSVSAWFNLYYTQAGRTYFSNYNGSNGWVVGIDDGVANYIKFYAGSATFNSTVLLSNSTWYHVVLTYDAGASPQMKLYINNGTPETATIALTYGSVPSYNTIGQLTPASNNQSFAANMTTTGYWNRALTSTEVSYLYNSGDPLQYSCMTGSVFTGLVAWYDMGEATGATRVDATGNGHNMSNTTSVAQVTR